MATGDGCATRNCYNGNRGRLPHRGIAHEIAHGSARVSLALRELLHWIQRHKNT